MARKKFQTTEHAGITGSGDGGVRKVGLGKGLLLRGRGRIFEVCGLFVASCSSVCT
jgi:hypothetical protein